LNLFERILEVDPSCRDETIIRKAYLEKVKQYHPDSSFQDNKADHAKFNQVQQAYEALLVNQILPLNKSNFCVIRKHSNQMVLLIIRPPMIYISNLIFVIRLLNIEHI
jgi:hypothetical protein